MKHTNVKKRGCKWCNAQFDSLITEEKTVKLFDIYKKEQKPPKGHKYVAKVVACKECGQMVRVYGPRLVEVEK